MRKVIKIHMDIKIKERNIKVFEVKIKFEGIQL